MFFRLSVALPFCDDKSDDEENEIFFGEITDKERRIADKYGKRRTILFDPRFRKDKKLMRNTIDNANERLQQENNYSLSDCFSTELKSQHKRRTVKFERILSNVEEERANENVMYQSTPSDPIDCTSNDCEQSKSIQDESMNIAASNEQVFSVANHEITDQRNEALTSSELNPDVNSCRSLNLSHCSGDSENQCASTDSLIKSYGTGLPVTTNDTIRSTNITGDTNLNDLETKNVGDFPILDCQADEDEIINCIDAHLDKISKSRNVSATTELENGVTSDTDITRMAVSDDIEIADEQDVIICNVSQINKQSRNFDAGEKDVQNVELIDRNSETVFGLTDMREALKGVDMITPDGPYEVNYCENNSIEAECNKQSVKQHDPRIAPFRVKTHEDRFYLKPPSSDIDSFKTDSSIKKDSHVMNVEDTTHRVRCDRVTPNCESLKNETNHINFTASYDQHDIRTEPTKHNVDDQDEEIEVLSSSDNLDKKDDSSRMNVDHADTEGRYSIAGIGNISVESIDQTHNYEGECESSFNADDSSMFNLKSLADTFYYDGEFFSINEFSSTASLSSRSGTRDRGRRKPPKPAVEDQALCSPNVPSTLTSPMTSFVVPPTMQAEPTSLRGQASLDDSMSPLGFTPYIPINMDRVLQQQQQWRQQQQQQQSQAPQSTTPAHRQAPQNTAPFYQPTNQMDVLTSNVQSLTNSDRELATEIPTSSEHYSQLNSQQMVSSYDVMSRPQESSHTQQSYGIIVHTETYSDEEDKENSPPVDDLRHPPNIQSTNINPAAYNDKLCKARDYSGMSNFSMNGVDIGERFKTMDYNDDDGGVKYVDERGYDSPMHHRQEMESVTKNAKVDGDNQKIEIGKKSLCDVCLCVYIYMKHLYHNDYAEFDSRISYI